uniref:Secreted protein n=1 Tax=Lygus hesperus TaxID=30085 RepID=A0A146LB72_LYGHE
MLGLLIFVLSSAISSFNFATCTASSAVMDGFTVTVDRISGFIYSERTASPSLACDAWTYRLGFSFVASYRCACSVACSYYSSAVYCCACCPSPVVCVELFHRLVLRPCDAAGSGASCAAVAVVLAIPLVPSSPPFFTGSPQRERFLARLTPNSRFGSTASSASVISPNDSE